MKIAQVCARYYPDVGGIETNVREISERLVLKGHDVQVICTDPTGRLPNAEKINGVQIHRFRTRLTPKNRFFFAPGICAFLRKNDFDLIHAHNFHSFPALLASFSRKKGRFIFSPYYHAKGTLLHHGYRAISARIFKEADKVICISAHELERVKKRFKFEPSKLLLVPVGINLKEFKGINPLPAFDTAMLYVGRLEKYKGIQEAIKVLKELTHYRLVVIGQGSYQENLEKLAQNLSVQDRIVWLKDLTRLELLRYYKSADVFLMLSKYESFGITVAEALAAGTPSVVVKGSALEDFVDGKSCVGLDYPINIEALKEAILGFRGYVSDHTPQNIKSWDEVVEELLTVYKSI